METSHINVLQSFATPSLETEKEKYAPASISKD